MSNPVQLQETESKSAPITEGNKTFCEHCFLFFSLVKKCWKKAGNVISQQQQSYGDIRLCEGSQTCMSGAT